MKTFFTLLASMVLSASVFAAAKPLGTLTIRSLDNSDIQVVLDGKRFNPKDNGLVIQGVEPGRHSIKVYKQTRSNNRFNSLAGRYELVYNSNINLKNRTHLSITIDRNGRIAVQESKIRNNRNQNTVDYDFDRDGTWGDFDDGFGYQDEYVRSSMNDAQFDRVLQSINTEWLESNKIKSATQVVRANRLSTDQVMELMGLFSFENNKLELAKQAYSTTVDKHNYSRVMTLFSFSNSRLELERHMRTTR